MPPLATLSPLPPLPYVPLAVAAHSAEATLKKVVEWTQKIIEKRTLALVSFAFLKKTCGRATAARMDYAVRYVTVQ